MSSSILPTDPALPGLAELLPGVGAPPLVREFAKSLLPGADEGRRLYVRYRPGSSVVVSWSFRGTLGETQVYAKLAARGVRPAAAERIRALAARLPDAEERPGWRYLEERGLALHAFGVDPRLPSLVPARDPDWIRSQLAPRLGVGGAELASSRPLSYKPERRCVFHYRWAGSDVSHYAKLFRDERGKQLFDWQRGIAAQLDGRDPEFECAAPVAYVEEDRVLVFPSVEGEKATREIEAVAEGRTKTEHLARLGRRAARGLAHLQALRLEGIPEQPPEALVARFVRDTARIRCVAPELAEALDARLARLDAAAQALPAEPQLPTHGAFRHGQLLSRDDAVVILDLDTLARSGASADAGNFLAYLDLTGLRRPRLRKALAALRAAFLDALPGADSPWLPWYQATSHLKIGLRSFRSLDPAWPRLSTDLLHCADAALDRLPTQARKVAAC